MPDHIGTGEKDRMAHNQAQDTCEGDTKHHQSNNLGISYPKIEKQKHLRT